MMKPTDEQMEEQMGLAVDNNRRFPGMSYEEGVRDTLLWVMGEREEAPMEDV